MQLEVKTSVITTLISRLNVAFELPISFSANLMILPPYMTYESMQFHGFDQQSTRMTGAKPSHEPITLCLESSKVRAGRVSLD